MYTPICYLHKLIPVDHSASMLILFYTNKIKINAVVFISVHAYLLSSQVDSSGSQCINADHDEQGKGRSKLNAFILHEEHCIMYSFIELIFSQLNIPVPHHFQPLARNIIMWISSRDIWNVSCPLLQYINPYRPGYCYIYVHLSLRFA